MDSRRNRCSYVQNTRIRGLPESIRRCQSLQMLYTAALRAKSRAIPAAAPSTPLIGVLRWDYHLQLGTDRRRSAGVLACVGHPPRPTVAPSCRRADATPLQSLPEGIGELESLKNLCVATRCVHCTLVDRPCHGAAQVHRPMQPRKAPRLDLQPHNLEPVRAAFRRPLHSESKSCSAPTLQGRVEQCHERATGVRVQHEQPDVAVRAARSLDTPRGACGRAEPSAGAAGTRSATSCKRCLTSQTADRCFTCVYLPRALLSLTCRYDMSGGVGSRQARRPQPPRSSSPTSAHVAAAVLKPPGRRRAVPRPCARAAYTVGGCPRVA